MALASPKTFRSADHGRLPRRAPLALAAFLTLLAALPDVSMSAPNYRGQTDRPLRYRPDGTDFVIVNGSETFNRPLYGSNVAFRADAGDRPEFSLYLPGRGGNLRLGIVDATGRGRWLHEMQTIEARYRPGSMLYTIRDPLLGDAALRLRAIASFGDESLILRAELNGATSGLRLVAAFGGQSGARGARNGDIGTERVPMREYFQLRPEACADNHVEITGDRFTLRGKTATLAGSAQPAMQWSVTDARKWASVSELLASAAADVELPIATGTAALRAGEPIYFQIERLPQPPRAATGPATGVAVASRPAPLPGELPDNPATTSASTPPKPAPLAAGDLARRFEQSEARRATIASRITVDTPDPFINAATAALCIAAEGTWDDREQAVMHGAVAWRNKLLGWRGVYWCDALGVHERTRQHLGNWLRRQNDQPIPATMPGADVEANLARSENALHSNGDLSNNHYDMNLVAFDALFRHLLWTGDVAYAREVWPNVVRHLAWERRLFRRTFGKDELPLYEGYASFWASDDVGYNGGGATYASAYNASHNRMAARIARLIGEDPAPYEREAELIVRAMRQHVWLPDLGWYGEWKDLLGLQRVHPSAAAWTVYHTIDSEVTTPAEAWQMSRYVDTQLPHIPIAGPDVPPGHHTISTTNWMPYTWSTNNVVMAEVSHTSLSLWQANRPDAAFAMFKGCVLDAMYLGQCPGNAGMASQFDMARNESQRDFADACGTLSRTLVEGLFGIKPDALDGELVVRPGFPSDWDRASIRHPKVGVAFRREGKTDRYELDATFGRPMALKLQVVAQGDTEPSVTVNGKPATARVMSDSVGRPRVEIAAAPADRFDVRIEWRGVAPLAVPDEQVVASGEPFELATGNAAVETIDDPQGVVRGWSVQPGAPLRGSASGTLGHRTVFARVRQGWLTWSLPIALELRPAVEIVPDAEQPHGTLAFSIRNNTRRELGRATRISVNGAEDATVVATPPIPPMSGTRLPVLPTATVPGTNSVVVTFEGGVTVQGDVVNPNAVRPAAASLEPVDLSGRFNDRVTQIFRNKYLTPRSPFCSLATPTQGIGSWCKPAVQFEVDDAGLRRAAAAGGGTVTTPGGIPFATAGEGEGRNVLFVSRWDNYPPAATVPLSGRASHVYLLMAGSTAPMQSRFENAEVLVTYADGSAQRLALENPTNWWPIDQDYRIDDFAFARPGPLPVRLDLRTGEFRNAPRESRGPNLPVPGGAATVLDLPLDPDRELRSLTVRCIANEIVVGLMAVTLERPQETPPTPRP